MVAAGGGFIPLDIPQAPALTDAQRCVRDAWGGMLPSLGNRNDGPVGNHDPVAGLADMWLQNLCTKEAEGRHVQAPNKEGSA